MGHRRSKVILSECDGAASHSRGTNHATPKLRCHFASPVHHQLRKQSSACSESKTTYWTTHENHCRRTNLSVARRRAVSGVKFAYPNDHQRRADGARHGPCEIALVLHQLKLTIAWPLQNSSCLTLCRWAAITPMVHQCRIRPGNMAVLH